MSELGVKKWLISTSSANWLCPNLAAGCPHPHRENGLKPSQRLSRLRTAKTFCVKCWTLAKINTSNPDLYSCPCWFRVEGSPGAQKYPHAHASLSRKNNSHPNSWLSRSVSRQSVVDGGKLITSSEETTSLKMVNIILISWPSSWIKFLFLDNFLNFFTLDHVPC